MRLLLPLLLLAGCAPANRAPTTLVYAHLDSASYNCGTPDEWKDCKPARHHRSPTAAKKAKPVQVSLENARP
jgi:hypothetical protein